MHVICFMPFGFLISSWKEFKAMENGHCFVLMSLQVWQIVGVTNLRNCTPNMKERYIQFCLLGFILAVFCDLTLIIY